MANRDVAREEHYYDLIAEELARLFKEKGVNVHLEITARREMSDELKARIPRNMDVALLFLKKVRPDITGHAEDKGFVVVEVKKRADLDAIYQLKKYVDLLDARFAFLVSLEPIPEDLKRLLDRLFLIPKLKSSIHHVFVLTYFDVENRRFVEWFEEDPFSKNIYWQ